MFKITIILLVYNFLFFSFADEESSEIEISSETMEWKREDNVAIALGEAQAIQKNRVLRADKIVVFFNSDPKQDLKKIYKLDASGKVKFINGEQAAQGDNATYFIDNEVIIIKGNVKLKRQDSLMLGEELSIDLKNNSSKLISGKKSQKVRAKYNIENKDEKK